MKWLDRLALFAVCAATASWLAYSWRIVSEKCHGSLLTCGEANQIGDVLAGMTAPLAFMWLIYTVILQITGLHHQRGEIARMTKQISETEAKAAFDAAVSALANRLIVNDRAWSMEWKGAKIEFDAGAYQTADDRLTIMKAEAELDRQISNYYRPEPPETRLSFIQKDANAFLEIRSALQRCVAAAKDVPESYAPLAAELNLDRFWRNVETITMGTHDLPIRFPERDLPTWDRPSAA
jgi:preprotein translocase subunit SecG